MAAGNVILVGVEPKAVASGDLEASIRAKVETMTVETSVATWNAGSPSACAK